MGKIGIIFDTNKLINFSDIRNSVSYLEIISFGIENLRDTLDKNNVKYNFFVPKIVEKECYKNFYPSSQNTISKIKKVSNLLQNLSLLKNEISVSREDISDNLIAKFKTELKNKNFKWIPVFKCESSFLLKRALEKTPPFKSDDSDNGLKDTLIWLSVLNFAKKNNCDNYVFITDDSGFGVKDATGDIIKKLKSEFKKETKKEIQILEKYIEEKNFDPESDEDDNQYNVLFNYEK